MLPQEQVITVELHQAQEDFCQNSSLYRGFVGGRGSGKSWAGAFDLLCRARAGRTYLVGSPTGVLMQDTTFPTFTQLAQQLRLWKGVKLTPYPNVTIIAEDGTASVRFRTAEDPEKMRGPNLSGVWLDEASLMNVEAYRINIAALRESGEQGWLSATFTPKGLAHWTYETFGMARPDTQCFHARTRDNPFNPPGFADTLVAQYGGAGSGLVQQELEGEFLDDDSAWQVIPHAWLRAAQARWEPEHPTIPLSCIGVDVAYGGADATVIAPRYGTWFAPLKKYKGTDTDSGLKAAHLVLREHDKRALIHVDAIGYGAACHEHLRELVGKLAVAVNVASAPQPDVYDRSRKYRLTNTRTAMYWQLREALDPENGDNLALPPDQEMLADLTAPRFEVRASGIVVEPKEKIKERLGRSPDCGDAVALAHMRPQRSKFAFFA